MSKKRGLALVKQLIKELSPKDRAELFPYLSEFPDSGVESYDLSEEIEYLKKHGTILASPPDDPDRFVVGLVFIRNHVLVEMYGTPILHATFFPNNFVEAFPKFKNQIAVLSADFQKIDEQRAARRANLQSQGISQTDEEFETGFKQACDDAARLWMVEKAKRIAEQVSKHLPGMVGDMMSSAIKGQTFYDLVEASKAFGRDIPSVQPLKKAVQDLAWRDIKPHLPSTRHSRTPEDWRDRQQLRNYAEKVNDRRLLVTCMKNMYEDCDHDEGWINDLKQNSNFLGLSKGIDEDILTWAIRRVADDNLKERDRQPLSIALELARRELSLTELDVETLRNKFDEGNKAIKAERVKKNEPTSGI